MNIVTRDLWIPISSFTKQPDIELVVVLKESYDVFISLNILLYWKAINNTINLFKQLNNALELELLNLNKI